MLRKAILAVAICLPLVACESITGASNDQFTHAAVKQNLKIGVTTSEQVRAIYGKPDAAQQGLKGPSLWSYSTSGGLTDTLYDQAANLLPIPSLASSTVKTTKTLHIHFSNNRVSDYSLGEYK